MTTINALISRGMRMLGVLGSGAAASAAEAADGLESFQGALYDELVSYARLTDVEITAAYTAKENERIFNRDAANATVTLPETVEDVDINGATITRAPKNGAIVELAGATHQAYAYVSHFGAWKKLQGLALTDESPIGPAYDQALAALTAVRMAPEYLDKNTKPSPVLVAMAGQGHTAIRQRFRQVVDVVTDPLLLAPKHRYY